MRASPARSPALSSICRRRGVAPGALAAGLAALSAAGCGFGPVEVPEHVPAPGTVETCARLIQALPEVVDDAVRRVLRVKLRAGVFERGRPSVRAARLGDVIGSPAHRAVARQAVRESLVLLKNAGGLLPLQPGDVPATYANVDDLVRDVGYKPDMSVEQGIANFVDWYRDYHGV